MESGREQIWNVQVNTAGLAAILDDIDDGVGHGEKGKTLFCANPHSLVVADNDTQFLGALHEADILIPDGAGIVLASRMLGGAIARRITGSDAMTGVGERWNKVAGRSFFFLGSSPAVLEKMKVRMAADFPYVAVAGIYAPPFAAEFSESENERMIDAVNLASPTALWVGMTAPKQEKWVQRNRRRLNVPLIGAVGAAFDYFAGSKQRASAAMQGVGMEWLPRLIREPRRMWRRNLISSPAFLYHILLQMVGASPDGSSGGVSREH